MVAVEEGASLCERGALWKSMRRTYGGRVWKRRMGKSSAAGFEGVSTTKKRNILPAEKYVLPVGLSWATCGEIDTSRVCWPELLLSHVLLFFDPVHSGLKSSRPIWYLGAYPPEFLYYFECIFPLLLFLGRSLSYLRVIDQWLWRVV